jgi:hypothetical protein
VVLGAGAQAGHPGVHEELVGVQRPGRPEHPRLAVPDRDVGQQLADLRLDGGAVEAVEAVVEPDPDRPRRHGGVLEDVEQLPAGPHLPRRVVAERQVAAVHDEPAGHGPGVGEHRGHGLAGPLPAAQQQAARRGPDRAAEHRPAADHLPAQVRHPLLVLLGERAILAWLARHLWRHGRNLRSRRRHPLTA